ncbi:MAG: (2Fe-2S)-binding protein [Rubrivivax sp.]|nr:MAG: (2Fe-2S)-binding protein [Rubrivivax sp.]
MIVCVCHRVSDRDIAIAASSGCPSFEALQDELRVATACGACHECACSVFEESRVQGGAGRGRTIPIASQARLAA